MAQNYFTNSVTSYNISTGAQASSIATTSATELIGGADIDDGFWNPTDGKFDTGTTEYTGSFFANGHLFLVFQVPSSGFTQIRSPTAPAGDAGYPATVSAIPTLTTTPLAVCFAAGTQIATPHGETSVEDLHIGDRIITSDGTDVVVKWVGRQTLHRISHDRHMQPVRIRADALGGGFPHSDLVVTADHGMVFPSSSEAVRGLKDGYVINASALVNGTTIDFVPMTELDDSFIVYHIETENHEVILANGAPSETFIDMAGRAAFDNYQEYLDLYGADRIIPEIAMPRIAAARLVPQAIKDRLNGAPTDLRAVG